MVPPAWTISNLWRSLASHLVQGQSYTVTQALRKSCMGVGSRLQPSMMLWKDWNYCAAELLVPLGQMSSLVGAKLDVGGKGGGCSMGRLSECRRGSLGSVIGRWGGKWQAWDLGGKPSKQRWDSRKIFELPAMGTAFRGMSGLPVEAQEEIRSMQVCATNKTALPNDAQASSAAGMNQAQPKQRVVPVYAYFVGRKIDLVGVSNDPQVRKFRRASGRDHVIIEFQGKGNQGGSAHLVVYKYGSIVLFNAPIRKEEHEELMQFCQRYTSEPIVQPNHEDETVLVDSFHSCLILIDMSALHQSIEGDRIKLKELDLDNMRVMSSVLGQSVALDQYSRQIDRALQEFNSINREMERTGSFTVTRQDLFRLVARNNSMITEAILVLGLLDRSDTAWTNDKYYGVWSMMQSEYELSQRFEAMDKKLSLIQESAKYFLQILQDNKSVSLEWFIIILIMAELVVGVYDLSTRH